MEHNGSPLFPDNLRYCIRCCMPETEEGTCLDEVGICQACQNSEQKMHINWRERHETLLEIFAEAKRRAGDNYDCIVPISGGKDSSFQVYVLTQVFGAKPLAVTFNHNWYSETGWYNLVNTLERFNVDHIMFTPNRGLVNRLAKRSVEMIGDTCWHCHAGVGAFSLTIAAKFGIPLMVFGESSAENFGRASYHKPHTYDRGHYLRMSSKKTPEEMACDYLTTRDLYPFNPPTQEEWDKAGLLWLPLGDYVFWDDERQTEFMRDNFGWRETQMENHYKHYKSAECMMPGMHDFTCYLKRGFGRATVQANIDARNGLMTREEGFSVIRQVDPVRPRALDYYLEITGQTEEEFYEVMKTHRMPELRDADMPILPKTHENAERILPFAQQILERLTPRAKHPRLLPEGWARGSGTSFAQASTFHDLSIGRILQGYASKEMSPMDVARLCIKAVEACEPDIQAWEAFEPERLLAEARVVEERLARGEPLRMLEGIPVGVKDVYNTLDYPTQMGSPLWEGFTPGNDARLVYNLKESGGLVAGKTVTAEFAVHELRKTRNPHDASRTPGTSSSGSAAAICAGMVPAALGTQTAASIVRPASFCGVYGFKPSFGLLPRTGVLKTTDSLDTLGVFSVYFEDLIRLFEALRVKGWDYPVSDAALSDPARQEAPKNRPWRVAFVKTHTWASTPAYARESVTAMAAKIAGLPGFEVEETEPPASLVRAHDIHSILYDLPLSYYFKDEFERDPDRISGVVRELIAHGQSITPDQYQWALKEQVVLQKDMDRFMEGYDALICLSTAGSAPLRHERELVDPGLMWTLTHLPAMSAPVFATSEGLPFGLQLVARKYNDYKLFNFATALRERDLLPALCNPKPRGL